MSFPFLLVVRDIIAVEEPKSTFEHWHAGHALWHFKDALMSLFEQRVPSKVAGEARTNARLGRRGFGAARVQRRGTMSRDIGLVDQSRRHGRDALDGLWFEHQAVSRRGLDVVQVLRADVYQTGREVGLLYPVVQRGRYIAVALAESGQRHVWCDLRGRLWRRHQPQAKTSLDWVGRGAECIFLALRTGMGKAVQANQDSLGLYRVCEAYARHQRRGKDGDVRSEG